MSVPEQHESRVDHKQYHPPPAEPLATASVARAGSAPLNRSERIAALAAAMAKAQGEIEGASKDKANPHFKSSYADLASVWNACREALSKNGLAVIQAPVAEGNKVTVDTLLVHSSGEWITNSLTMNAQQNTPQAVGSAITYARRYALASMVGVAPEDDDGNAASQTNGNGVKQPEPLRVPDGFDNWLADLECVADEGTAALEAAWKKSQPYLRKHLTDFHNGKWTALKARAAKAAVSA